MAKGNMNYTPKKWLDMIQGIKNFGKIKVGNTTVTPISNDDTFELASGTNITLNADNNTKKVIINGASAVKNPAAFTLQLNGTSQGGYDGSSAKTVNITAGGIGAAVSSHSHTKGQITDFPTTLKNPAALTIQLNGSSQGAYDGSSAKTININSSNIGAAASNHSHSNYSTATNIKNGTAYRSTVEGDNCTASGLHSHAEGRDCTVSGREAHAEGCGCTASGSATHAAGEFTIAKQRGGTVIGRCNIEEGDPSGFNSAKGSPLFIIGGGLDESSRSNVFKVYSGGNVHIKSGGSYNSSGADYGEFFEWLDENKEKEDRIGYFVTLDEDKIKIANEGDYILGAVSGISGVIGNSDEHYAHRWKTDDFGRLLTELKTFTNEITGDEYTTDVNIEKAGYVYEQDLEYTHRADRKEWDVVGMLGVLIVRDDGTCKVNSYCKVTDGGIATTAETGYRVIKRVSDNIIKIVFR